MGRIRSIKPEILDDEKAALLPDDAWRLWVSMWVIADDEGRLPGSTHYLHTRIFWAHEKPRKVIQAAYDRLAKDGLVQRYRARGADWVRVVNWKKHQRINKPQPAKHPGPEEGEIESGTLPESYVNVPGTNDASAQTGHVGAIHGMVTEHSTRDGMGRDGIGRGGEAAPQLSTAPDPGPRSRLDGWSYAAQKYTALQLEGIEPDQPSFPAMPVGVGKDLYRDRYAEALEHAAGDHAGAVALIKRRVDFADVECRRDRTVNWMAPSLLWRADQFWKATERNPESARKRNAPGRPAEEARPLHDED